MGGAVYVPDQPCHPCQPRHPYRRHTPAPDHPCHGPPRPWAACSSQRQRQPWPCSCSGQVCGVGSRQRMAQQRPTAGSAWQQPRQRQRPPSSGWRQLRGPSTWRPVPLPRQSQPYTHTHTPFQDAIDNRNGRCQAHLGYGSPAFGRFGLNLVRLARSWSSPPSWGNCSPLSGPLSVPLAQLCSTSGRT